MAQKKCTKSKNKMANICSTRLQFEHDHEQATVTGNKVTVF